MTRFQNENVSVEERSVALRPVPIEGSMAGWQYAEEQCPRHTILHTAFHSYRRETQYRSIAKSAENSATKLVSYETRDDSAIATTTASMATVVDQNHC